MRDLLVIKQRRTFTFHDYMTVFNHICIITNTQRLLFILFSQNYSNTLLTDGCNLIENIIGDNRRKT